MPLNPLREIGSRPPALFYCNIKNAVHIWCFFTKEGGGWRDEGVEKASPRSLAEPRDDRSRGEAPDSSGELGMTERGWWLLPSWPGFSPTLRTL